VAVGCGLSDSCSPADEDFKRVGTTNETRREWLGGFLDSVIVRSANRRSVPVAERMKVRLKGRDETESLLELRAR
jgi:hypothetical protein